MYLNNVSETFSDFYLSKNDMFFTAYNGCACGACGACGCITNENTQSIVCKINAQNIKI